MNPPGLDDVIVIQDQDQRVGESGDIVYQADHGGFSGAQLGGADDVAGFVAHLVAHGLNRGDEVGPEPDRVVVALVEGEPGRCMTGLGQPAGDQGGFSESRRGRDEG